MENLDKAEEVFCYSDVMKFVQEAVYPNTIEGFLESL